jgi:hypothetical protein
MNFIHFGCWNNIDGNVINLMKFLKKYTEINKIDFINIAGDNYYPTKIKKDGVKQKIFNYDSFKIGFDLLNEIKVEKNMIFGNHDILDFNNCISLIEQQKIDLFNIYNKFMSKVVDNTIIFYLDSTIYELYDSGNLNLEDTCYVHLYPKFKTIKDIIHFQQAYVIHKLSEKSYKNIIFTFHHPIFTAYVSKKGVLKTAFIENLKQFYVDIYYYIKDKNVYHLCADTHFYQHSNIEIDIEDEKLIVEQYIVGTGGTILDYIHNHIITFADIIFKPIQSIQNYGFLHIKQIDDKLHFYFIHSLNYFKNKYLKYKKKYFLLKYYE